MAYEVVKMAARSYDMDVVFTTDDPEEALREAERRHSRNRPVCIWDTDDYEAGDVTANLEDANQTPPKGNPKIK